MSSEQSYQRFYFRLLYMSYLHHAYVCILFVNDLVKGIAQ